MTEAVVEAAKRTDSLIEAVQGFLRAETWEASRAIVVAEPSLLSDEALDLMDQLVERARAEGDERSASILEQHRVLLEQAKSAGVEAAFAGLVRADGPEDLGEILAELAEIPDTPSALPRRIELSRLALAQVSKDQDPEMWALMQSSLGTSLLVCPIGDRSKNLEESITALQTAAGELGRIGLHDDTGRTLNNLGLALESRWYDPPDENLERAIKAYEAACIEFERAGSTDDRAQTLTNLANAYNRRTRGGPDQNREHAIALYEEALALFGDASEPRPVLGDEPLFPPVRTRLNLGVALMERYRGDRLDNLERAIIQFESALPLIESATDPAGWGDAQVNLANALARKARVTSAQDDFQRAVSAYEAALEVYQDTNASLNRALALSNLGNTLRSRPGGASSTDIERAIAAYEEALHLLGSENQARDWALAQNNLGEAYLEQPSASPAQRFERAIAAFQRAAEALDERSAPVEYAQVMKNLGTAYRKNPAGDRDENLGAALRCYEEALRIRSVVYGRNHPRSASVLYSIARAHSARGDHRAARDALEEALAIDETSSEQIPRRLPRRYRLLADTAARLKDWEGAERAVERALSLDEELYGPDHPDVFIDLRRLAEIREAEGRYAEAASVLGSAVALEELGRGEIAAGARASLAKLADLLLAAGDVAGAEHTMERAVALDETLFGPDHPRMAESLLKLAKVLGEAREVTRAHETLERAKKIEARTRGRMPATLVSAAATVSLLMEEARAERLRLDVVHAPGRFSLPARVDFSETLRGALSLGTDDPQEGRQASRRDEGAITLELDVTVSDLDGLLDAGAPPAAVTGRAQCALLGGVLSVGRGTYTVRAEGEPQIRYLEYWLELVNGEGQVHVLRGRRTIDPQSGDLLAQAMSMPFRLQMADSTSGAGLASIRHLDFLRELDSIRVTVPTPQARAAARTRFGRAFFGPLWEFYESRPPGTGSP